MTAIVRTSAVVGAVLSRGACVSRAGAGLVVDALNSHGGVCWVYLAARALVVTTGVAVGAAVITAVVTAVVAVVVTARVVVGPAVVTARVVCVVGAAGVTVGVTPNIVDTAVITGAIHARSRSDPGSPRNR